MSIMNYYKDLNYHSSMCLVGGTDDAGVSAYFAESCMKKSLEAIRHIEENLRKEYYRKKEYIHEESLADYDCSKFNARKGMQLPPNI